MKKTIFNKTSLILVLGFVIHNFAVNALASEITIVARTFIPNEHPSKPDFILKVPGNDQETMIPGSPTSGCFKTDQRLFDPNINASSRYGGKIVLNLDTMTITSTEITGTTHEVNCDTGEAICTKKSGAGGFSANVLNSTTNDIVIAYSGEASNPCLLVAPDIEFSGTLTVDKASKSISLDGKIDSFPAFEAYVYHNDGTVGVLYQQGPASGATPFDLINLGPDRNISGADMLQSSELILH